MTSSQTNWWWAFLCSLIATAAMSLTALIIMIYTDTYRVSPLDPENDPSTTARSRIPIITGDQSFKTVLTISSKDPNASTKSPTSQQPTLKSSAPQRIIDLPISAEPSNNNFVNLSAPQENNSAPTVTVVDIPAMNAKKNILRNHNDYKLPSNLASVGSTTMTQNSENAKRDRKRNQRLPRGARKKK